jgi:hypothetical protein
MSDADYFFACPKCGAKKGEWCTERMLNGGKHFTTPHIERLWPKQKAGDIDEN